MATSNLVLLGRTLAMLRPGAAWQSTGETYEDIVWLDQNQTIPSETEFNMAFAAQKAVDLQPNWVDPQDLLAQLTTADIAAIQAAISSSAQSALLWFSLLGQRDPMNIANARFKAGWSALVAVLGQPRMTAIATALGVTIPAS
jgi:hypothetical protein